MSINGNDLTGVNGKVAKGTAPPADYSPSTPISNSEFLTAIFGSEDANCWVTSFFENPAEATGKDWKGCLCPPRLAYDRPDGNTYFSVASFQPFSTGRTSLNFAALAVVVLDDPENVPLSPSWLLQTSPGNYQAGYRLKDPVTDLGMAKRLHDQLGSKGHLPVDKHGNNTVRYVRLPVGSNTKHDPPFRCVLETFDPELLYTLDQLIEGLRLDAAYILHGGQNTGAKKTAPTPDGIIPETTRNCTLASWAGSMRRPGMSQGAIEAALLVENRTRCCPPLDEQEVIGIARSISSYAPGEQPETDDLFEFIGDVEIKPIDWLIQDYFEANTFGLIFGQPGTYKTFLALDVAVAVASGKDWHGYPVHHSGPVIYLCGEGRANLRRRVTALCLKRGIDIKTLPLIVVKVTQDLSDAQCIEKLKRAIAKLKEPPVLIVVDTLARHYGGKDENSNTDMGSFIKNVDDLRGADMSVLMVHHSGHTNTKRPRGASSLPGGLDAEYLVEINEQKIIKLTSEKMKDADKPPPLYFDKTIIQLGFDEKSGAPATSVVLEMSSDQQKTLIDAFYKTHPELARGKRKEFLPELLVLLHTEKGIGQNRLANRLGTSDDAVNKTLKILKTKSLVTPDGKGLTPEGFAAAMTLSPGQAAALLMHAGGENWPLEAIRGNPNDPLIRGGPNEAE